MTLRTPTFRWSEKYSVNIATLDDQHRHLFVAINELNQALANGQGGAVVDPILKQLGDYAVTHFAAEETLLTEYKFQERDIHRAEHEKFLQSITKFLDDYHAGKPGVPVSLLLYLQTWLKEHILITDKAYSSFLNARGVH
jgi:hemerythrin